MSHTNLILMLLMLSILVLNFVASHTPRIVAWLATFHDADAPGPNTLRHVH